MTSFAADPELGGSIADAAVEILNSGKVNFDVISADGKYSAALALVEIKKVEDGREHLRGYVKDYRDVGFNGVGEVFVNHEGLRFGSKVNDFLATTVHEANHLDREIDTQRENIAQYLESIGVDLSDSGDGHRMQVIIEEKLARDATRIIGEASGQFKVDLAALDMDFIVEQYSRGALKNAQISAIKEYFSSDQYATPTALVNDGIYGTNANGRIVEIVGAKRLSLKTSVTDTLQLQPTRLMKKEP